MTDSVSDTHVAASEAPILYNVRMAGIVYLVGAGPGDPGLITVRGRDLLARAQVVVYDHLANPQLLDHAPSAERVYVGKKAAEHSMSQEAINALLVERAKRGRTVVRLKGGDPFVFGRGGEECVALAEAGIRFEVVPGITAAIAAPAYAGIPVTHRDLNSSFIFVTGHEKERDYRDPQARQRQEGREVSDIDWSALAKLPCLAFYMGLKSLRRICRKLIEHGMDPAMPAAAVQWATTVRQRTVTGTVTTLPDRVAEAKLTSPVLTIVGQVVKLRQTLNWFESRPLFGQTVLVTRTRQRAGDLSEGLMELGAHVIEVPTIDIRPPTDWSVVDEALCRPSHSKSTVDWLIFTSPNGPAYTRQRLKALGLDVRVFGRAKIAASGPVTAQAIEQELALRVDLCPDTFRAEALADALSDAGEIVGQRFLLLRADIARPILRTRLEQGGAARVEDVSIYETVAATSLPPEAADAIRAGRVDWITFTSGSTARNFFRLLPVEMRGLMSAVRIASIGPITSDAVRELGLTPTVQASSASIAALTAAIREAS